MTSQYILWFLQRIAKLLKHNFTQSHMKDNTSMSIPQNMGKYSMLMPIKIFLNSSEIFHITIPDWSEIGPRSVTVRVNQKGIDSNFYSAQSMFMHILPTAMARVFLCCDKCSTLAFIFFHEWKSICNMFMTTPIIHAAATNSQHIACKKMKMGD